MSAAGPMALIEFPADDPERALRFWGGLLDVELEPRRDAEGSGWQSRSTAPPIGVHARGPGPGDTFSLPYFGVDDLPKALERVEALGGSVIHPRRAVGHLQGLRGKPVRAGSA
jgi:predicted enzyme related to lactoylglutathione lyase